MSNMKRPETTCPRMQIHLQEVFKDEIGVWLGRFSRKLDTSSMLMAEH